jgi:hypothetical protein
MLSTPTWSNWRRIGILRGHISHTSDMYIQHFMLRQTHIRSCCVTPDGFYQFNLQSQMTRLNTSNLATFITPKFERVHNLQEIAAISLNWQRQTPSHGQQSLDSARTHSLTRVGTPKQAEIRSSQGDRKCSVVSYSVGNIVETASRGPHSSRKQARFNMPPRKKKLIKKSTRTRSNLSPEVIIISSPETSTKRKTRSHTRRQRTPRSSTPTVEETKEATFFNESIAGASGVSSTFGITY